jgi:magnesium transporter
LTVPHERLNEPVLDHVRRDFPRLAPEMTVESALESIRRLGLGERIVYFYVVDGEGRLLGILPTRRLLMGGPHERLDELMIRRVVTLPDSATLVDACERFVLHRFLALPVIDAQRKMIGVVDVDLFTQEVFDFAEREQTDGLFEALGFRLSEVRDASAVRAFRFRFPWLLSTIASGSVCAVLASRFESTLARSLVLAFFLALVLALGESVSIQAMTVTIQALRSIRPTWKWFTRALSRELATAALLGLGCGITTGAVVSVWRGPSPAAFAIGSSIALAIVFAAFFGVAVPSLLHALRLDPKIAAGPLSLALSDVTTLLCYFLVATAVV